MYIAIYCNSTVMYVLSYIQQTLCIGESVVDSYTFLHTNRKVKIRATSIIVSTLIAKGQGWTDTFLLHLVQHVITIVVINIQEITSWYLCFICSMENLHKIATPQLIQQSIDAWTSTSLAYTQLYASYTIIITVTMATIHYGDQVILMA